MSIQVKPANHGPIQAAEAPARINASEIKRKFKEWEQRRKLAPLPRRKFLYGKLK